MATAVVSEVRNIRRSAIWAVLLLIALLFAAVVVSGWPLEDDVLNGDRTLSQRGQFFVANFTPASQKLSIYSAEMPIVELKPENVTVKAQIFPVEGPMDIDVTWTGQSFFLAGSLTETSSIEVEVQDRKTFEREVFRFALDDSN